MDTETEKKLQETLIEVIIDGEKIKLPSTELFFLWRAVTCYADHTKLKNYLKRILNKQLDGKIDG
jgi:hypothetical protein